VNSAVPDGSNSRNPSEGDYESGASPPQARAAVATATATATATANPGVEDAFSGSVIDNAGVLRQLDGTTCSPVAWDYLPRVSALVGWDDAGRLVVGQLRRRRRGRGVVVAMSRPGF
jgi:hypothetical protein